MSGQEPNTSDTSHPRDWEAQRERLSAYLDEGQLPADERAALERHLLTCARCTAELAELRRTVALLRALPSPALPRSFALPDTAAIAASRDHTRLAGGQERARSGATPTPLPTRAPQGGRPPRWSGIAQWVGGLAAVAGLVVLLGGAFSGLPSGLRMAGASTAAGATNLAPNAQHTLPPTPLSNGTAEVGGAATATTPATVPPEGTPHAATGPFNTSSTGSPLPILPLTGGGLVLGGGLIFIAGRAVRRRRAV